MSGSMQREDHFMMSVKLVICCKWGLP